MFREDAARLPSDIELARSRGLPLTFDDLRRLSPKVPESENGAYLFIFAMRELEKLPENLDRNLRLGRNSTIEDRMWAERAIADFQPTMRILEAAVKRPYFVFETDPPFQNNIQPKVPWRYNYELAFQKMLNFISAGCRSKFRQNDAFGELKDLSTLLSLAEHFPRYSTPNGSWTIITAEAVVMGQLTRIARRNASDTAILDRVAELLARVRLPDLYKLIQTEFVIGHETILRVTSLREIGVQIYAPDPIKKAIEDLYQSPGVKQAYEANFIRRYIRIFEKLPQDSEDWPAIHSAIAKMNDELDKDKSIDNVLNRALGRADAVGPLVIASYQAELRILQEAVAALRQHSTTGKYPMSLPIPGPTAIDPLWHFPLRYMVQTDGFTISSTGRDFGKYNPMGMKSGSVFRYTEGREPGRMSLTY